jgi:hypothetical protein
VVHSEPDAPVPVFELDEKEEVDGEGPATVDAGHRRRVARMVVAGIVLVTLSVVLTEVNRRHAEAAAEASRLAVDVRVDAVPQVQDPQPGVTSIRGDSSLDVKLHNLGPKPVHLMAVTYQFGQFTTHRGSLLSTDVVVASGQQMDQGFHVVLPCGPTRDTAVPERPVRLTAHVRTADGTTHSVRVDLGALDDQGGLFDACASYAEQGALNADSELVRGVVHVSLDLPDREQAGADTVVVTLSRRGIPAQVAFVSSPRLPARARDGTRFTVTIRPVVRGCPSMSDLAPLSALGLSFGGDETYVDPYLPLLVAQAIGRACASSRR